MDPFRLAGIMYYDGVTVLIAFLFTLQLTPTSCLHVHAVCMFVLKSSLHAVCMFVLKSSLHAVCMFVLKSSLTMNLKLLNNNRTSTCGQLGAIHREKFLNVVGGFFEQNPG